MAGFDIAPYGQAIAEVGSLLNGILKRILPEKISEAERAGIEASLTVELLKADTARTLAQLAINQKEAESTKLFVSGWRPFVGWVCGTALLYHFMLQPFAAFVVATYRWETPPLPTFDMSSLMTILIGMLGLAAARTYERVMGVAAK